MFPTRISYLLIAATLVSVTGCSGSRLRNMVTRSDYKSLDELAAQDSVKEAREAADRERALVTNGATAGGEGKLVSQQREVADAADDGKTEEPDKKRGFLNLAGMLSRDGKDHEISPDPFLAVGNDHDAAAEKKTAAVTAAISEDKTAAVRDATESGASKVNKAEQYVSASTDASDTAEEMFRNIAAADSAKQADAKADESAPNAVATAEASFADFIAKQTKKAKSEFEQKVAEAAEPVIRRDAALEEAEQLAANAPAAASAFDELLGTATAASGANGKQPGPSDDLMPGLDELLAEGTAAAAATFEDAKTKVGETADSAVAAAPSFEDVFSSDEPASDTGAVAVASANPFAEAESRASDTPAKETADEADPWAAFREGQQAVAKVNSGADAFTTATAAGASEFDWANRSTSEESAAAKAPASFANATASDFGSSSSSDSSPFSTASATNVTSTSDSTRSSGGLVIPPRTTQQVSSSSEATAETVQPVFDDSQAGPFAANATATDGDDLFAQADDELFAAATADAGPEVATAGAGTSAFQGWSTRTWFFLLGCIIVALVLFMPERQKRTNP